MSAMASDSVIVASMVALIILGALSVGLFVKLAAGL